MSKPINKPSTYVADKVHNKQKEVTAQTFRRLAKALRVRARNHLRNSKALGKSGALALSREELTRADIYSGVAQDCDNEVRTLRAMR